MTYQDILLEKKNGLAKITLNRPQVLNALSERMMDELEVAFAELAADESVGVIIITGAGRAFSAGRDMKEIEARAKGAPLNPRHGNFSYLEAAPQPVIAAVNGFCYTGALELLLCCDLVIASEKAVFADTHARYGMTPIWGGSQRLPRLIGPLRARQLSFTSEPITAQEAERIGLVNQVVPAENLVSAAEELARKILGNSPASVRAIKRLINHGTKLSLTAGLRLERAEYEKRQAKERAQEEVARLQGFLGQKR